MSFVIYRIKLVLPLHVVLYEHDIMYGFLQLERVFLPDDAVTHALVESGQYRRQSVVAAQAAQGADETTQSESQG